MRFVVALAMLAGCGVKIDDSKAIDANNKPIDAAVDGTADARPCTGGDMTSTAGGGCLLLFTTTVRNWMDASTDCIARGTHLAVLDTAAKHAAAKALAGTKDAWIGLSDVATEMQFRWVDNTPFSFTAWDPPNEPSNGQGAYEEDCVLIAGARGGDWDDRPCSPAVPNAPPTSGMYGYLCQF